MKPHTKKLTAFVVIILIGVSLLSGATFAQDNNSTYSSNQETEGDHIPEIDSLQEEHGNSSIEDSQNADVKGLDALDKTDSADEAPEEYDKSSDEINREVPSVSDMSYTVSYSMHVQDIGWLQDVADGTAAGTAGSGKRAEAVIIHILTEKNGAIETDDSAFEDNSLSITYRAHVQDIGWQDWVSEGSMSGTTGQSKRMEALEIQLTGTLAQDYDVYYRAYVNTFGWMSWAKNGETSGSTGFGKAIESLEILLYKKDAENAPVKDGRSCYTKAMLGSLNYAAHVQDIGWQSTVKAGGIAGTTGKYKRMEALTINRNSTQTEEVDLFSGGISYRAHVQNIGWQDWVTDGSIAGTTGISKRMEAIQIKLTGDLATYADVYYRAHIQNYGWLGWAKNGQEAGSTGISYRMEAIQIVLVPKDRDAPGNNSGYFKQAPYSSYIRGIDVSKHNGTIDWAKVKAAGIDYAIIRCGYGDNITSQDDTKWKYNVSECERLGIPYGVYIYSYATSVAHAQSEADHCIRLLKGHKPSYPIFLDLEDSCMSNLSNAKLASITQAWATKIVSAGYTPGVYSSKSWWTNKLTSSNYNNYCKWVAQWNTKCTYTGTYHSWQYSSTGSVKGIAGNVDMDYWYGYPNPKH